MSTSTPDPGRDPGPEPPDAQDRLRFPGLLAAAPLGASPGLKVADVEAENLRKDAATRRAIVWPIVITFIVANGLVYAGVYLIFSDEVAMSREHVTGHEQVVTANVVLALIAATAAQCGAITVGVFRHFFPPTARRRARLGGAESGR